MIHFKVLRLRVFLSKCMDMRSGVKPKTFNIFPDLVMCCVELAQGKWPVDRV